MSRGCWYYVGLGYNIIVHSPSNTRYSWVKWLRRDIVYNSPSMSHVGFKVVKKIYSYPNYSKNEGFNGKVVKKRYKNLHSPKHKACKSEVVKKIYNIPQSSNHKACSG